MIHRGTYDGTIYYNPANKFCIISVKTAEKDVPEEARSIRRRKDHLIRFVATGYELPRTDAVELELDGEWKKGKYGMQLQVEQWHEIVPQTKSGVEGYLASGLIKGIGPALAKQIVSRFGVETLDILQNRPERLLEIKGITENKLEAIKTSYAESRMLQDLMTLLSPFKITPKTAQKIYQFFGPASVDILKKSPFELCQISGFGFLRVDAIVQKNGGDLRAPSRLLRLFIFCGLLGIVHIDAIRIRDGKDLDKTQFGYFLRSLQEVIDADNIIGLELIRQSGGQRFYGQGDSNLTRGDVVERHIGGNRDAAHLTGENIVARSQIRRHIQPLHILKAVSHIGGKVIAAYLHNLGVFFGDLFAFEHRLGDADNFRFPVGLPGNGGQSHKSNDCCQYQGQNTENKSVVEFHKHILLS